MSSLLDSLGIDPESFAWHELGTCQGDGKNNSVDPENFFDNYESDVVTAIATDAMCMHCPVAAVCLQEGIDQYSYGVWGGIYLTNGRIDPVKNQHKTSGVWQRLEQIHERKL
jgi:hypothetical protein